jgi:hypothetical protein
VSSSSTVSPLSDAEDIAQLQAIFEEDKSLSAEGNHAPKTKRSSGNLKAVKDRLKKHISRELRVHKGHSRSSVGTSGEEIERRAELRRIRQRRIQDELSNEFNYDPDAKSLPNIAGVDFTGDDCRGCTIARCGFPFPTSSPGIWTSQLSSPSPISPYLKE